MFTITTIKLKIFSVLALGVISTFIAIPALAAASFQGGTYIASNATGTPGWADPVNANVGDVIEFKFDIKNLGDETATNIRVKADLPTNVSGNSLTSIFHVVADNGSEVTDTATINIGNAAPNSTHSFVYYPGHATIIRHPENTQASIEQISSGGYINIGNLANTPQAYIEVLFKFEITEKIPPVSPSPSPSASSSPSPSASPSPSVPPQGKVSCPEGFKQELQNNVIVCVQVINNNNACTGNSCNSSSTSSSSSNSSSSATGGAGGSATVNITNSGSTSTSTTTGQVAGTTIIKQLPATGLPLVAWAAAAFLPLGFSLKGFKKGFKKSEETPNFIWENRKFNQD